MTPGSTVCDVLSRELKQLLDPEFDPFLFLLILKEMMLQVDIQLCLFLDIPHISKARPLCS